MVEYTHIEVLVEDRSGRILVENILQKYAEGDGSFSYKIQGFKGIGSLPRQGGKISDVKTGKLLTDLPHYLRGLDVSLRHMKGKKAIFVILDSDNNDCAVLKAKLMKLYDCLGLSITVFFCIAIEEMEAWLLGDEDALKQAFPQAKLSLLHKYEQDSIIGTWEYLADVVYPGGVNKLKKAAASYYEIGEFKCACADRIGRLLNIRGNVSPSFNYFIGKLDSFCAKGYGKV